VDVICATAGHVIQTLPGGKPVQGVTSLDNLLYVLRGNLSSEQIEVYDKDIYRLQRKLTVPRLGFPADITACGHNRCAYISDGDSRGVHRVALPDAAVKYWLVGDIPFGLSVTDSHSVLVTCIEVRKIKEFSTDGRLLRQLELPIDVSPPRHTVQLSREQFVVCHGGYSGLVGLHRVCLVGSDAQVIKSFGRFPGSGNQQLDQPGHLAVDRHKCVFVADYCNGRVLLLSPSLTYIREIVSRRQLNGNPTRLYLDEDNSRLYVAVDGSGGRRVVVVSV